MLPRKETAGSGVGGGGGGGGSYEPYALEDMISSLRTRGASIEDLTEDPMELLRQRERDLVLAAELGKALLERNQDLTRQSEALAEGYATKVEVSKLALAPAELSLLSGPGVFLVGDLHAVAG